MVAPRTANGKQSNDNDFSVDDAESVKFVDCSIPNPIRPNHRSSDLPPNFVEFPELNDDMIDQLLTKYAPEQYAPQMQSSQAKINPVHSGESSAPFPSGAHLSRNNGTHTLQETHPTKRSTTSEYNQTGEVKTLRSDSHSDTGVDRESSRTDKLDERKIVSEVAKKRLEKWQNRLTYIRNLLIPAVAGLVMVVAGKWAKQPLEDMNSFAVVILENKGIAAVVFLVTAWLAFGLYLWVGYSRSKERKAKLVERLLKLLVTHVREKSEQLVSGSGGAYPSRFHMEEVADEELDSEGVGEEGETRGNLADFCPAVTRKEIQSVWKEVEDRICDTDSRVNKYILEINGKDTVMLQWMRGEEFVAFGREPRAERDRMVARTGLSTD